MRTSSAAQSSSSGSKRASSEESQNGRKKQKTATPSRRPAAQSGFKRAASEDLENGRMTQKRVASSTYRYERIRDDQIRVLDLFPAFTTACKLEGSLSVLQRAKPEYDNNREMIRGTKWYEALSYTWEGDEKPCTILVDGCLLDIGRNLHDALLRIRLPHRSRRLWIDAVCINQSDDVEKTGQVKAMWQIYADAKVVLVWLGEDCNRKDGREAFAFCRWAAAQQARWEDTPDVYERIFAIMHCYIAEATFSLSVGRLVKVVQCLLGRPWFQRLWTVQEFALAADIAIHCGRHSIGITPFTLLLESPLGLGPRLLNFVRKCICYGDEQFERSNDIPATLINLMDNTLDFGYLCKDPRDRVAALISMSNTNLDAVGSFSVNYAESVERNYVRFAKYLLRITTWKLEQTFILQIAAAKHPLGLSRDHGLPSWVPDWRKPTLASGDAYTPRDVNVAVLFAVGHEVQLLDQAKIRLRLVVSDDSNISMKQIESLFEQQERDPRGNGFWTLERDCTDHGDLVCYFAKGFGDRHDYAHSLTLRKSQLHGDSWMLVNRGTEAGQMIDNEADDPCYKQLRENFKCLESIQTAIELDIV